jgi:hypothetical protein
MEDYEKHLTIIGIFLLYFFPSILAGYRNMRNSVSIYVLNFFLGWTIIGWIVALIWATSHENKN